MLILMIGGSFHGLDGQIIPCKKNSLFCVYYNVSRVVNCITEDCKKDHL